MPEIHKLQIDPNAEVPAYLKKALIPATTPTPEEPSTMEDQLFAKFQEAEDLHTQAEEAMAFCKEELNEACQAIFEKLGPGPFTWKGRHLRFVQRKGKEGDTYYARKVNAGE